MRANLTKRGGNILTHIYRTLSSVLVLTVAIGLWANDSRSVEPTPPISLHPDNPSYFLWRGKPAVLITSGEHYGALLNLDFDFVRSTVAAVFGYTLEYSF